MPWVQFAFCNVWHLMSETPLRGNWQQRVLFHGIVQSGCCSQVKLLFSCKTLSVICCEALKLLYYLTFFRGDKVCQERGHQGRGEDEGLGVGKVFLVLVKESTLELKVERSRLKVKVEEKVESMERLPHSISEQGLLGDQDLPVFVPETQHPGWTIFIVNWYTLIGVLLSRNAKSRCLNCLLLGWKGGGNLENLA